MTVPAVPICPICQGPEHTDKFGKLFPPPGGPAADAQTIDETDKQGGAASLEQSDPQSTPSTRTLR